MKEYEKLMEFIKEHSVGGKECNELLAALDAFGQAEYQDGYNVAKGHFQGE